MKLWKNGVLDNSRHFSDREQYLINLYAALKDIGFGNLTLLTRERMQELKETLARLPYLQQLNETERAEFLRGLDNPEQLDHNLHEKLLTDLNNEISSVRKDGGLSKEFSRNERWTVFSARINVFDTNVKINKLRCEIRMLEEAGENLDSQKEQLNELEKYTDGYEKVINNLANETLSNEFGEAAVTEISVPETQSAKISEQNVTDEESAKISEQNTADEERTPNITAKQKLQMNALLTEFNSMDAQDKARHHPIQRAKYMEDSDSCIEQGADITKTISEYENGSITDEDAEQKLNELKSSQYAGIDSPALYGDWADRPSRDKTDIYVQIAARITTILDDMLRRKEQAEKNGDEYNANEDPYEKFSARFFDGDPEKTRQFHILAAQYCRNSTDYSQINTADGTSVDRRAFFKDILDKMAGTSQQSFQLYLSQTEKDLTQLTDESCLSY
jgi:hypothetical protein